MATILGLSYGHHGSACIVRNGKLIAALSTERLTRNKFCYGVTDDVIDCLFNWCNIGVNDIDYIAIFDWNKEFALHPISVRQNGDEIDCLWNRIYDNTCVNLEVDFRGKTFLSFYIGHQLGHAAAAFYTSPFDEAYCFTMDASGAKHKNNSLIAYGKGTKLTSLYCPGLMVGVAYGFFTEYLGLGSQMIKAGTTMALAGYGKVIPSVEENLASYVNGCFFPEDKDYVQWYMNLWPELSGSETHLKWMVGVSEDPDSDRTAKDVAATIQCIFENAVLQCINTIDSGDVKNLCLSGGSMLNCTANSLVLQQGIFENIHLFPGCGDDGGCIGTSLYVAHNVLGEPRHKYTDAEICFLGPDRPTVEPDYSYLAQEIAKGKIVAWCNGRAEYGPRALGNRSLFADPRDYKNRERINFEIKNREWFRPLAPVVLEEHAREWFDFPVKSPFMLFTMPIKDPDMIPAINHIDNTARIQTVSEESNPYCYRLIKEFQAITGVPVLINTSLNGSGEPMIETDENALDFFNRGLADILVLMGKYMNEILERPAFNRNVTYVEQYLIGKGLDMGCGRCPLERDDCLHIDISPQPEAVEQVGWDNFMIADAVSFESNEFYDYVFSSHMIEDLESKVAVIKCLNNWSLLLKAGGYLVLLLPDMQGKRYCPIEEGGNPSHKVNAGKKFIEEIVDDLNLLELVQLDTIPHDLECTLDVVFERI